MADVDFPSGLPLPQQTGYRAEHTSTFARTSMASGRARQRRTFTSVPSVQSVTWQFTTAEAQAFEAWFRDAINDGGDWFNCNLVTPVGLKPYECRFAEMYEGPSLVGYRDWSISARLEIKERPILEPGWGLFTDLVLGSSIIDVALNQEWPEA